MEKRKNKQMNILLFGDIHIKKEETKECALILKEIDALCNQYNVTKIINLGDTFDKVNPASECLDLFATFIKRLNRPITILAAQSHESTTPEESILNHFGVLNNNVDVVKEYKDTTYMLCGHYVLNESKYNYDAKIGKKELRDYKYVFLGHQHQHQIMKPNICHLGSCRYIDFAESEDKNKVICLIEDYQGENEKLHFLALNSPYPMVDIIVGDKNV